MFRFLIDSTPLEVSVKDILFVAVSVLGCLLGIYLAYLGLRAAVAPRRYAISDQPNWGAALFGGVFGTVLVVFSVLGVRLGADEDPNMLNTFRSLAGAHVWAVRLAIGGGAIIGIGFILLIVPPTVAAWLRQRRRRARGEPDPEVPPFARPRRRRARRKPDPPSTSRSN